MSKLNERYPNGYMGKIEYWTSKLNAEVFNTKNPQLNRVIYMNRTLQYFLDKQEELEHPIKQETFQVVE